MIDRTKARRSTASANDFGVKMIRAELNSGSVRSGAALFTSPSPHVSVIREEFVSAADLVGVADWHIASVRGTPISVAFGAR